MFKSVKIIQILSIICIFPRLFQNAVKVKIFKITSHSGFWLDFSPRVSHVECVCFRASLCRVFWLCWGIWRTDTTSSSCRASPVKTTCGWGAHPLYLTDNSSLYTLRNMSNILSFSLSLTGLSPAYLHCVSHSDKTRDVPQRLDGHAARH